MANETLNEQLAGFITHIGKDIKSLTDDDRKNYETLKTFCEFLFANEVRFVTEENPANETTGNFENDNIAATLAKLKTKPTGSATSNLTYLIKLMGLSTLISRSDFVTGVNKLKEINEILRRNTFGTNYINGDLSKLNTDNKDSFVKAVNEIQRHLEDNTTSIGDLGRLDTKTQTNLVAALNEVRTSYHGIEFVLVIDDNVDLNGNLRNKRVYSAKKLKTLIAAMKTEILGGASSAYDTLKELETLLEGDGQRVEGILNEVKGSLRFDIQQTLTEDQRKIVCKNLGLEKIYGADPSLDWDEVYKTRIERYYEPRELVGVPGTRGFGVAYCPDWQKISWIKKGLDGHDDPASDNYGNYETTDGSIVVCIPKFYYRWGNNSTIINGKNINGTYSYNTLQIEGANKFANLARAREAGYALHRAFIDGGKEHDYFFVDKYMNSFDDTRKFGVSKKGAVPILLGAENTNYKYKATPDAADATLSPFSGSVAGCEGNASDALYLARKRGNKEGIFNCISIFQNNALAMLALAQAQASQSTSAAEWFTTNWNSNNFVKGATSYNANGSYTDATTGKVISVPNAIYDYNCGINGTSPLWETAGITGLLEIPKTGATKFFNMTTHNGNPSGVADLAGFLYSAAIGVTNYGTSNRDTGYDSILDLYVLRADKKLADLTPKWNDGDTPAFAINGQNIRKMYVQLSNSVVYYNLSAYVGNNSYQTFGMHLPQDTYLSAPTTNNSTNGQWIRTCIGSPQNTNYVNGSYVFGYDYIRFYTYRNLMFFTGGFCKGGQNAGVWSVETFQRHTANNYFGFRSAAYYYPEDNTQQAQGNPGVTP